MSFREKTAWVTLIALVAVSLMYWFHVPSLFTAHRHGWILTALGLSLAAFLLIEAVAWVVLYLRNPREARTPRDEREQLIELKATRIASWVYVVGSLTAMFVALHMAGAGPVGVAMSVVLAFVLGQVVRHAAIIIYHRRGA